jgi:hypothetical protein
MSTEPERLQSQGLKLTDRSRTELARIAHEESSPRNVITPSEAARRLLVLALQCADGAAGPALRAAFRAALEGDTEAHVRRAIDAMRDRPAPPPQTLPMFSDVPAPTDPPVPVAHKKP